MIEHMPETVDNALFYFHSAGTTSDELQPFLPLLIDRLPNTYVWAGDGVISRSPLMRRGLHYASDPKRYWFTFPMQDASSAESFASNVEAMGATLTCAGAYVNALVDGILARLSIPTKRVVLCGFQHGSCVALAASMMRLKDPYASTILFEPYVLETYYLRDELVLPETAVFCVESQYMRTRTRGWLDVETDQEFQAYGIETQQITVPGDSDTLDASMMDAAIGIMQGI